MADKYIVTAAWGSWHEKVPAGHVGVHAVRGGRLVRGQYASDDVKYFLVPDAEYAARGEQFVIDEHRHMEMEAIS